ncbi:Protoheme IX farnesyltransferase [Hartmannibacter diazotrophicus]|uniref:Protoheme IX farnesyltransferase n=1 Tax=Hartmannibacter diazotrophicus TaxID=1482074 RepID=A0A2C9D2U9_9HYPH|nr:heme o synthase [Hartmannibacter diazotrophicus]SON54657.1 Protoheme IX farnesyltransferase [Hartmannibacter diazotrophicus]
MSLIDERTGVVETGEWSGGASVGDFFELLKPRVMSLVIFTALVGMVMAPGGIHPLLGAVALLCIAVGAGASGALNMWYDADIDQVMKRTAGRPIPSGRVAPEEALSFGLVLAVMSVFTLGVAVNWQAASLLAFTIFFYVVVYTMWLKRSTPQNIVIGGAAGAFPPMIGWAAVTGSVSLESLALFMIIFLWTPPHFWALALVKSEDYARANIPMMPVVAGRDATRRQIVLYSLVFVASSLAPWAMGFAGVVYGAVAAVFGVVFIALSLRILREGDGPEARRHCMRLFLFSILHLFVLFAVLLGERLVSMAVIAHA